MASSQHGIGHVPSFQRTFLVIFWWYSSAAKISVDMLAEQRLGRRREEFSDEAWCHDLGFMVFGRL